jgi:chromosome segregation ATPase
MGKAHRKQFFARRQYNLRRQEEEDRQQRLDELDIENHRLRFLLSSSLEQTTALSNEINNFSLRIHRHRHRYRDLEETRDDLQFQLNAMRAEVERLRNLQDIQSVQNLQRSLDQLRRNFRYLLEQLQQRSIEYGFSYHVSFSS